MLLIDRNPRSKIVPVSSIAQERLNEGPIVRRNCHVALAFLGVPEKGDKIKSGDITPAFWGPQVGGIAMQPLRYAGYPKEGTKSEVATSTLPSQGARVGRHCYVTPAFLGSLKEGTRMARVGLV